MKKPAIQKLSSPSSIVAICAMTLVTALVILESMKRRGTSDTIRADNISNPRDVSLAPILHDYRKSRTSPVVSAKTRRHES